MEKIKTGICSFGLSGKVFHAPFINEHPGFELTAIVERHREESREKYGESILYRSVEEMLANPDIQFVIINTPVQTHFEYAKKALDAGKHILVEKPFTVESKEAAELAQLAEEKGLKLIVYQNRRYDGDFKSIRNIVSAGVLGDVKEMEIRFDRYRPVLSSKMHKEKAGPGGGTTYDLGPHLIDQALVLFGWPTALYADEAPMRPGSEVPDYFEIILFYPGKRVRLKATSFARQPVAEYIIHGTTGTYLQERTDQQEALLLNGATPTIESWCPPLPAPDGLLVTEANGNPLKKELSSTPGNYMDFFTDIHQYLIGEAENPVPPQAGVDTIRIIEAARKSSASGQKISLS